jgi:Ca-activated chloride channel family protein
MSFTWPWMLPALLAVPLLVHWYRGLERRRTARRAELAALGLLVTCSPDPTHAAGAPDPAGHGRRPRGRRLVPMLFLAATTLLLVALARPQATVVDARREGTVILAFDVSGSMAATDLTPTRIDAAKAAARRFVGRQPSTVKLGVVAFGDSGLVMQRPTSDRAAVLAAVDRLTPRGGTSLGRGMQSALGAIVGRPVRLDEVAGSVEAPGPDLGYHGSAAMILLSDGENTAEPDPVGVAEVASTAGIKVYPIGLGSPGGTVLTIDGFQVATALDEALLQRIASTTNGRYYAAADEQGLAQVYDEIEPVWAIAARRTEVTGLLAGAAGVLLVIGATVSLARNGRVI